LALACLQMIAAAEEQGNSPGSTPRCHRIHTRWGWRIGRNRWASPTAPVWEPILI